MISHCVAKHEMGKGEDIEEWIVCSEINHGVFPNIPHHRYSSEGQSQKKSRDTYQSANGVDACSPRVLYKLVEAHIIFSMPESVAYHKFSNEQYAEHNEPFLLHATLQPSPPSSQQEKENTHKHIVYAHPQGIVIFPQEIADEGE